MADTDVTSDVIIPLSVDVGNSDQSIEDLDKRIEELVARLATLTTASIEYYKVQEELIKATTAATAASEKFDSALSGVSTASVKMISDTQSMSTNFESAAQNTVSLSDDLNNLHTNLSQSGNSAKEAAQGTQWYEQTLASLRSEGGLTNVTLNELKATQKDLEKAMADAQPNSEEWIGYRDALKEVKQAQTDYKDLARDSEGEMKLQANTIAGIRAEVRALTKEWANTDMGSPKFEELSIRLADTTEKLKGFEASVGNHKRDVGNYAGQIGQLSGQLSGLGGGFKTAGAAAQSAVGGVNMLNVAFKALLANPIVLVIAAVAAAVIALFNAIKKAFKENEQASNALKQALAPLQVAFDAFGKVLDVIVGILSKVIEGYAAIWGWLGKMAEKLPIVGKHIKDVNDEGRRQIQIEKDRQALEQKTRDLQVENARDARDIAEFKANAADKEKYSAQERLDFLNKAIALEREQANTELAIAAERLRIFQEETKNRKLTKAQLEELAKLQAEVYNAETAHFNKMKELNGQVAAFNSEIRAKEKADADAAQKERDTAIAAGKKAAEERAAAERKAAEELAAVQSHITQTLSSEFDNRRSAENKAFEERRAILIANNESTEELERIHQDALTQIDRDEVAKRSQDAAKALADNLAAQDAAYKAEQDAENVRKAERDALRAEAQAQLMAAEAANDAALREAALARLEEYRVADEEAETALREKEAELLSNQLVALQEQLANEQIIGAERVALEQQVLDAKNSLALNAAARAKAAADKELADYKAQIDARKKLDDEAAKNKQKTQATINAAVQAGINIAGEGTVAAKVLNTAQAVMSTWAGAAQALNNPFPYNLAAMAATLTAGFKSIKEIWAVKVPGASGDAGSSPNLTTPTIDPVASYQSPIVETHSNITADEIDEINKAQKVYVVESDISDAQARVSVVENEASF